MNHSSSRITYICLTAAIGGLLFGFDTAVISGTISFVKAQFALTPPEEGWFVSSGLLGCILGVILTSFLSDRLGRKKVMILSGFMFLLSGIGCAFAPAFNLLVSARLIGGIGVGMASVISPMYIAEFAPATSRGRMIAYYQLAITIGILLAYFSNALLLRFTQNNFQSSFLQCFLQREIWRPMFFVMSIPSAVFMALLIKIPESPRWLFSVDKKEKADAILKSTIGSIAATKELDDMNIAALKHSASQLSVFSKSIRLPLFIGITLGILQQFCGINAIIYYGPTIFESAGITKGNALVFQVIIGTINLLFTFVAIKYADKFGRRFLLLTGLSGIVLSLVLCGMLFYSNSNNIFLLCMIVLFIACFALSVGPVTWIIINEIFPTEVRSKAVAICTFSVWAAVWIVGQFFPWLLEKAGPAVTFWTFAFFSLINLLFSWFIVKETKNKTLEEMEQVFVS
ncbi:MAG TPA: sugar porter family MFS transporter [Chitinophagales bacterium]|nr:sugar porter family MFS transporter [Chitinophagales bacterium]